MIHVAISDVPLEKRAYKMQITSCLWAIHFLFASSISAAKEFDPEPKGALTKWSEFEVVNRLHFERSEIPNHPKLLAYRAYGDLEGFSLASFRPWVEEPERRLQWAERAQTMEKLKDTGPNKLELWRFHAPWPVSDRCACVEFQTKQDTIHHWSVDVLDRVDSEFCRQSLVRHQEKNGSCVVAHIEWARYELVEKGVDLGVLVELAVDPRGDVPAWIVNWVQKSVPKRSLLKLLGLIHQSNSSKLSAP